MAFLLCMALMCPLMMYVMSRAMKKPEAGSNDSAGPAGREAELAALRAQLDELRAGEEARRLPPTEV